MKNSVIGRLPSVKTSSRPLHRPETLNTPLWSSLLMTESRTEVTEKTFSRPVSRNWELVSLTVERMKILSLLNSPEDTLARSVERSERIWPPRWVGMERFQIRRTELVT